MTDKCASCGALIDKWESVEAAPPPPETYLWAYNDQTGERDWGLFFGEVTSQQGRTVIVMKRKTFTHYNLARSVTTTPMTTSDLVVDGIQTGPLQPFTSSKA